MTLQKCRSFCVFKLEDPIFFYIPGPEAITCCHTPDYLEVMDIGHAGEHQRDVEWRALPQRQWHACADGSLLNSRRPPSGGGCLLSR